MAERERLRIGALAGAASLGVAGIVAGALVSPAQAALWVGLVLLAAVAGFALQGRWRTHGRADRLAQTTAGALEASAEGWYVSRADGSPVFSNDAFKRLAGLDTPDALLSSHAGGAGDALRRAVAAGSPASAEMRIGDASERWLRVTAEPTPDQTGQVAWRLSDVTESHRALDEAEKRAAGFRATLDDAPVGLYATDHSGRIVYANRTLSELFGQAPDVLTGRDLRDFLASAPDASASASAPAVAPADGAALVVLKDADGVTFPARMSQSPSDRPCSAAQIGAVLPESTDNPAGTVTDRFEALFERAPIGIAILDADGGIVDCNGAFRHALRVGDAQLGRRRIDEFIDEAERAEAREALLATLRGESVPMPLEVRVGADGERVASLYANRIEAPGGDGAAALTVHMIDTTEQKSLELQFAQAQKMQAVGQLAGGIAHDFNNLLTAIIGFCDLLLMRHQAGDHSFADIMQIKQNGNRAANLVRQLLAFSRQQTLKPETLSVTDVLAELSNLLRRLIGEKIELKMTHGRDIAFTKADQGQLEQVIINLVVNARDAMADGGTLTIRTSNVSPSESVRMGHELLPSGDYVLIEVQDTGIGIPKEKLGKIFEPFFTTKDVGAGTGLGLSTVYGIVKQFGGYIFVNSAPGEGATFSVFLPQCVPEDVEAKDETTVAEGARPRDLTGRGTILLVEDEDAVRMFGARALRNKGYTVLEADCGEMALDLMRSADQPIDLLVTDVVMPGVDGPTLTKQIKSSRPDLKVIYISGYAEDAFRSSMDETINFLPKPFGLGQLATKVKEVMSEV